MRSGPPVVKVEVSDVRVEYLFGEDSDWKKRVSKKGGHKDGMEVVSRSCIDDLH